MYKLKKFSSLEIQGQIVGTRESLNGRKDVARKKVKNGEKSPWGQCLTRPVPNGRRHSGFWLVPEKHKFPGTNQKPERRRPFGTGLVRHCPQGLFSPFFTFFRVTFSRPFRLSFAPFICPWVSEDEKFCNLRNYSFLLIGLTSELLAKHWNLGIQSNFFPLGLYMWETKRWIFLEFLLNMAIHRKPGHSLGFYLDFESWMPRKHGFL